MDDFKPILRQFNNVSEVFDPVRKKYVAFTPEEFVRQYVINYLIKNKDVPPGCISIEKSIRLNRLSRRVDIAVYNEKLVIALIIECKAPEVELTQDVFDQVFRYNIELNAKFVAITNGRKIICSFVSNASSDLVFFSDFPDFNALNSI
jgi:hypothetical protein